VNQNQTVSFEAIEKIFEQPLLETIYQAKTIHQKHFPDNAMQLCTLLSIKTGACPEDCAYCPQSAHYRTSVEAEKLMEISEVVKACKAAKKNGATRFCMGAAYRSPPEKSFANIITIIKAVKDEGLETCVTLGMLTENQAEQLKVAGLDFYNHNIDTSPEYYKKIITTRRFEDRLETLALLRKVGIKVCSGGILGMGESRADRIEFLKQLVNLPQYPESVTFNYLMRIEGTPLAQVEKLDFFEFLRCIAVARILMPSAMLRLSAGREYLTEECQALCFMAGANSIFLGEKLLTAKNPTVQKDTQLLQRLGISCNLTTNASLTSQN
jgi:biotin synthase